MTILKDGLKMIDIFLFTNLLKQPGLKSILTLEMEAVGKCFLDTELQRYAGKAAILGNLNPKDIHSVIKISDPFVKETLEFGSEISLRKR